MSRFREELRVIPGGAWLIAALAYLAMGCFLFFVSTSRFGVGSITPRVVLMSAVFPVILFVYVLLIGYVNQDARRRGMRHVLWTLLVIFIPNGIGFILYFILREPLMQRCGNCGADMSTAFPFCPACGSARAPVCPECRYAVEPHWSHCVRCGAKLEKN